MTGERGKLLALCTFGWAWHFCFGDMLGNMLNDQAEAIRRWTEKKVHFCFGEFNAGIL